VIRLAPYASETVTSDIASIEMPISPWIEDLDYATIKYLVEEGAKELCDPEVAFAIRRLLNEASPIDVESLTGLAAVTRRANAINCRHITSTYW
jgi:hypothetical protein